MFEAFREHRKFKADMRRIEKMVRKLKANGYPLYDRPLMFESFEARMALRDFNNLMAEFRRDFNDDMNKWREAAA